MLIKELMNLQEIDEKDLTKIQEIINNTKRTKEIKEYYSKKEEILNKYKERKKQLEIEYKKIEEEENELLQKLDVEFKNIKEKNNSKENPIENLIKLLSEGKLEIIY